MLNKQTYEMYKEEEFYLILINNPKMEKFEFKMTSMWNSKAYEVRFWVDFNTFTDANSRYYQTFFNWNFITLKNLSIKYNYNYFCYFFFDEAIKIIIKDMRHYQKHASAIIKYFLIKREEQLIISTFLICYLINEKYKKL